MKKNFFSKETKREFKKLLKEHKILLFLIFLGFFSIVVDTILSYYVERSMLNNFIMITTFIFSLIYIYPWRFEIDKQRIRSLCFNYLFYTIFPALIPAIASAGLYNFSILISVIGAACLIVFALLFHSYFLYKELKMKKRSIKIRILEKIKTASGFILPIFSLIVVFRLFYVKDNGVSFLINSWLLFLTIISIYRGTIELVIYNIKYPEKTKKIHRFQKAKLKKIVKIITISKEVKRITSIKKKKP